VSGLESRGAETGYRGARAWLPQHDPAAASTLAAGGADCDPPEDWADRSPVWPDPVAAAQAIPAGRLPFNLNADAVLSYTVINGPAGQVLQSTGSLRPQPLTDQHAQELGDAFVAAYDWMRWQMHRHILGYTGGFPLWVWARTTRRDLVSTAQDMARESPGSVLICLRIPRTQLLLTDYFTWHDVLNGSPAVPVDCVGCGTRHCDDAECWDRWFDGWFDGWGAQIPPADDGARLPWWCWPPDLQTRLFASWEAVHSLRRRFPVQGCVERIEYAWVQAIRPLR
jgi:hypothetical protein